MSKSIILALYLFAIPTLFAQPKSLDDTTLTLAERYALMKSKAQTYGEYKAVKEVDLDAVFKTTQDSLKASKKILANANKSAVILRVQIDSLRTSIQETEASVQDVLYDSTHISMLGISFSKGYFVGLIFILMSVMIIGLVTAVGRMKFIQRALIEKSSLATEIALEFANYKRNAMEKQTKLARELQTELNKSSR